MEAIGGEGSGGEGEGEGGGGTEGCGGQGWGTEVGVVPFAELKRNGGRLIHSRRVVGAQLETLRLG